MAIMERIRIMRLLAFVDAQAKDAGLWFDARTAAEAYLQQELRKLHKAIEDVTSSVLALAFDARSREFSLDDAGLSDDGLIWRDGATLGVRNES